MAGSGTFTTTSIGDMDARYNLGNDDYKDIFLDHYGRSDFDPEIGVMDCTDGSYLGGKGDAHEFISYSSRWPGG